MPCMISKFQRGNTLARQKVAHESWQKTTAQHQHRQCWHTKAGCSTTINTDTHWPRNNAVIWAQASHDSEMPARKQSRAANSCSYYNFSLEAGIRRGIPSSGGVSSWDHAARLTKVGASVWELNAHTIFDNHAQPLLPRPQMHLPSTHVAPPWHQK